MNRVTAVIDLVVGLDDHTFVDVETNFGHFIEYIGILAGVDANQLAR